MSSGLKPYGEYRNTETLWFNKIPSHWNYEKLGTRFKERRTRVSDQKFAPLSVTKKGIVPQLATAAKTNDGDNRKLVKVGDFTINSRSDRKGSSGLSNHNGSVSLINIVLKPIGISPKYSHYLLKSHGFIEEFYRNGRGIVADLWTTRYCDMGNIFIPLPPHREQDQIVRFLDWKLSQINRYIWAKKKQIELQKEQIEYHLYFENNSRNSTINLWDEAFPKEWEMIKAKRIFKEVSIKNCPDKDLLAVTQDRGIVFKKDCEQNYVSPSGSLNGLKLVRKNDYVISLRSFQGGIELSNIKGIVSPAYNVFCLRREFNQEGFRVYYKYLFKTKAFISLLNTLIMGIRDGKNISFADFSQVLVPLPPKNHLEKVVELVKYYENHKKHFGKVLPLLSEYSVKLISDVVTGKIDVRNIAVGDVAKEINGILCDAVEEIIGDDSAIMVEEE